MNLTDQVTSLDLAKRLRELGVKQSSLFFWTLGGIVSRLEALPILDSNYSAFTVSELGNFLKGKFKSACLLRNNKWYCQYTHSVHPHENDYYVEDENEANARAKMLIYLIENKIMELPNQTKETINV